MVLAHIGKEVAVLGDVSGSMSEENRLDLCKQMLKENAERLLSKKKCVLLGTWNHKTDLYDGGEFLRAFDQRVSSWIENHKAGGGTNSKQAIEKALTKKPALTDVIVMCDGDLTPYKTYDEWCEFRDKHKSVVFHWVALGKDSEYKSMAKYAQYQGCHERPGTFYDKTC